MEQLKVPTRRIEVEVFLVDGANARGSMFHRDAMYESGSPGDVFNDMNDDRDFLPFDGHDQVVGDALLSKRHIIRVAVCDFTVEQLDPGKAEQYDQAGTSTLVFDDGSRISGRLVLETPFACSRLVDKFNQAPAFVPFVTDRGVELVNRAHIVRILVED